MISAPRFVSTPSRRLASALASTVALATCLATLAGAQAHAPAAGQSPRWRAIHDVFGQGEAEGRCFRVNLPRSDLHVRIGDDALDPGSEFTSYLGFAPSGSANVMAMGEVIVLDAEVAPVVRALGEHGLDVTAIHTHMLDDGPPHFRVDWYATGDGPTLARGVAAALVHMNGAREAEAEGSA